MLVRSLIGVSQAFKLESLLSLLTEDEREKWAEIYQLVLYISNRFLISLLHIGHLTGFPIILKAQEKQL